MNNRQYKRWVKRIHRGTFTTAQYFALTDKANHSTYGHTNLWNVMHQAYRMWMK